MNNVIDLIRLDLREFNPYSSARDEASGGNIWLNANESPFDVEWQEGIKLNRYPDKQPAKLIERLAAILNVENDQIAVSRGSDEMIDLLIRLFCSSGKDAILTCTPTYGMYKVYAKLQGAKVIDFPLSKDNGFQIDLSALLSCIDSQVKIVFLCSPNNPTGNLLKTDDILMLCKSLARNSMVVIDEAYIDYADCESLSRYINEHPNLVILRTLSKAYGLAAARLGMLLANKNIIQWILKIIAPYPLSSIVSKLVIDSISSESLLKIDQEVSCIKSEKAKLLTKLNAMSFVKKVWPSEANFLLIETNNSQKIMDICNQQGIIIRSMFDKVGLEDSIRISIGKPEENEELIRVLQEADNDKEKNIIY